MRKQPACLSILSETDRSWQGAMAGNQLLSMKKPTKYLKGQQKITVKEKHVIMKESDIDLMHGSKYSLFSILMTAALSAQSCLCLYFVPLLLKVGQNVSTVTYC